MWSSRTQRTSVWWLLSSVLCWDSRERAARHHRQILQWVAYVCEGYVKEKGKAGRLRKWQYPWEREQASTTLHTWPVFQNIIWQHVHLSYVFFCRRKPNRLKEVCWSQTASLLGSDPSAHWHQRGRKIHLATEGSSSTKHIPTGEEQVKAADVTTGSTDPNLIGCRDERH